MKKSLKNFEENQLTLSETREVKGGIGWLIAAAVKLGEEAAELAIEIADALADD